ncbi:hypothetical protein [Arthrobacter sp. MDT1-65]
MSEHNVSLSDFEDVQVRGLAGDLKRHWRPKQLELLMNSNIGIDSDENRAKVEVEVELFGSKTPDDGERILTYAGSVSLHIVPNDGFQFVEGVSQANPLLAAVWPIARTSLIEHAHRLGAHMLRVPISVDHLEIESEESTRVPSDPSSH